MNESSVTLNPCLVDDHFRDHPYLRHAFGFAIIFHEPSRSLAGTGYEWVTPHTFRRTVATVLDRERSTDHAAAQLGHSDTTVTKTHYIAKAHRAPDVSDVLQQLHRPPTAPPLGL